MGVIEENLETFKREAKITFAITQRNRHSTVAPYSWFGPDPEVHKAGDGCLCPGCVIRMRQFKEE